MMNLCYNMGADLWNLLRTGGSEMKLLICVLNDTDKLDELMIKLAEAGVKGATIINSTGMGRTLYNHQESALMNSLRALLDPDRDENKTIFTVVDEAQEKAFHKVMNEVVGDLARPDSGIIFTIPVDSVTGLSK
ncbi:hypothetical protein CLOSTMETH_01139 [[Clostridium] methylpentosum DSM 5476]|uniref:Nitrogen regulatory protein P-II n=1 Tax=[Clostridium] methylpentosum DSM 5476 TaxID=537013 RepID=C0EBC1_9FIRM|nr:hypothetical protein CLOSTMETH_01139 [[Clostridium] methylpentosum DSM 5476]